MSVDKTLAENELKEWLAIRKHVTRKGENYGR
jgi:hypothetical protein